MMIAVSPLVSDRLSVVIVRVRLHEVSPSAMATAVAMASARYLIALTSCCFCMSVNGFMFLDFNRLNISSTNPTDLHGFRFTKLRFTALATKIIKK